MTETSPPSFDRREPEPRDSFLEFLLTQPQLQNAEPSSTEVYFDLDETMFKRVSATSTTITGTWRRDMPEVIAGLKERGFSLGILSSAQEGYIRAALEIYGKQFLTDPSELFDDQLSTRSFDALGSKEVAFPAVAAISAAEGKLAIFVDDAPPEFREEVGFGVVTVPPASQYQDKPSIAFEAEWA